MTSHGEWFRNIKDLKTPGFVETGDNTTNWQSAIDHARWANKVLERCTSCPTITKKLVSIGQMVEQRL